MKIRRYEIDYIFKTLDESQLHNSIGNGKSKFICIPRYNACINLKLSSIHFFFTHVYKIRTYKTYFIWCLLNIVALVPFLHGILNLVNLQHQIKKTDANKGFNWTTIDLIYVEWHFFGLFSKAEQTVTHVLAKEAYLERFQNELNARKLGKDFKGIFPELIRIGHNPKFYVEELAVDQSHQFISKRHFKKSQKHLRKINRKTLKKKVLDDYYKMLIEKIGILENEDILQAFKMIKEKIESEHLRTDKEIKLALVHGDFNKGQILVKDDAIKIIDWGDGGFLNRYFDYISISIYKSSDNSFDRNSFPNKYKVLNKFFKKKFKSEDTKHLYVLITLLEILAVSKGEFDAKEGAYPRWLKAVENNIEMAS